MKHLLEGGPTVVLALLSLSSLGFASPVMSKCAAPTLQAIAPPEMTIGPIENANLDLGQQATGVSLIPATDGVPEYCVLTGTVVTNPSTRKTANFAMLMPENWDGKLLFQGCSGLCGVVFAAGVPTDALLKGYAIAATDDGHVTETVLVDASWALTPAGTPDEDAIIDWSYRAVHQVAIAAKQLAGNLYSAGIRQTYFQGCSGGGREAMVEAIRYPADFDGIIAGAPAADFRGRTIHFYAGAKGLLRSNSAYIPPDLLSRVDEAVRQECDGMDGVVDGLIQNPARCNFKPESLQCQNGNTTACLSKDQVGFLQSYLNAVTDNRQQVAAFGAPISDLMGTPDSTVFNFEGDNPPEDITAAQPWGDSPPQSWFGADSTLRYLVYRNPTFNSNSDFPLNFSNQISDRAVRLLDKRLESAEGNEPGHLAEFIKQGRKLILYHGFSDGWLSAFGTVRLYEATAGLNGGFEHLQSNARLFMVPGMYHCGGGPGPNSFDMLTALENWVEKQRPPEGLIATKFVQDDPSQSVTRTMPLCKFPEKAHYRGSGDIADASNWFCPANDSALLEIGLDGLRAGVLGRVIREPGTGGERHR